jgi:hypothetical protein
LPFKLAKLRFEPVGRLAKRMIRSITSCDGKPKPVFVSSFVIWLPPNEFFETTNTDAVSFSCGQGGV